MLDSMANQTAQHSLVHDEEAGAGDRGMMPLVEAAALGASSPGAVVRVPTTTTLSQADQIALRYQHQASNSLASGLLPVVPFQLTCQAQA